MTTPKREAVVKWVSSYSVDYEAVTPVGGGALVDAEVRGLRGDRGRRDRLRRWSRGRAERGASFWLVRLARDRVRRQARARVAPAGAGGVVGARATRAMLQKAWPESPGAGGEDRAGPYGGSRARAAAASFLAACLSATADGGSKHGG